ncbi:MAG: hypothetical protein ABSB53_07715 [Nitrososphaerales archaeon]
MTATPAVTTTPKQSRILRNLGIIVLIVLMILYFFIHPTIAAIR